MSDPMVVSAAGGAVLDGTGGPWSRERRAALKEQWRQGALWELVFEATVFTTGPNRNFVRFRAADLPAFAAGFVQAPFLRNHRIDDIGARDGTVLDSYMLGDAMRQRIVLTTQRGIRDFLDGVIDRFSIGWYYSGIECAVCGGDWLGCEHIPGRRYPGPGGPRLCELIFLEPQGKETSAVNTPAATGTHVLAHVRQVKEQQQTMSRKLYLPNGQMYPVAPATTAETGEAGSGPIADNVGAGQEATMDAQASGQAAGLAPQSVSLAAADSLRQELQQIQAEVRAHRVAQMLATSGLGQPSVEVVRLAANDQPPEVVAQLIEAQRKVEAAAVDKEVVRGIRPITDGQMETPAERLQSALNWIFGAQGEALPAPSMRSIRDLYQVITGDFNWYGTFNPEYSQLAAASTTTLAGMVVDALNRVIEQHFNNMMVYRWFEPIVSVVPHSGTTHDVNLIMVDGMANLPTVGEGAAYTEAIVGDSKETMAFIKRGHYVGITLEAIRKSDIQRIQAIPREMVKSSVRTRSAAIAGIFTQGGGVGPTLAQDSKALFHNDHGNLSTTAFDYTAWAAARTRIWKQQIPGTGKALGLWPTFALFPIDLFDDALEKFGYGAGDVGKPTVFGSNTAAAQTPNPYGQSRPGDPRPIPIAVPDWTDSNDWAYITDPRLHPVIHMGYANAPQGGSHPMPEIYEATGETQGLLFTNDTLPVKVRDWWAFGVATYVGVGKNNVT